MNDESVENAIEADSLDHGYEENKVLRNLSFSVAKGGFFIVIGPNGSGKTTLLKVVSGIEKPEKGSLRILGKPVERYSRKSLARTVAFVPQMAAVDFPFTAGEVVAMGRSPHKGLLGLDDARDREVAAQSMEFTGVEHLANRKLDKLSGGEQQRVFIARAICQEPEVILLDEPTAALDLAHQVRVMDLMERLQKEKGVTIVMVSHDINLACMYAQTLLLLKDGEVVSIGSPEKVLTFDTLEKAYGCTLLVDRSPLGDFPRVTPVPKRIIEETFRKFSSRKNDSTETV